MNLSFLCLLFLLFPPPDTEETPFAQMIQGAETALQAGQLKDAKTFIDGAIERDPNSRQALELRYQWAKASCDKDEQAFTLNRLLYLAHSQDAPAEEIADIQARIFATDPLAEQYRDFKAQFVDQLTQMAKFYESKGRPHSAIRMYNAILALAPERTEYRDEIGKIASAPDPSLADSAQDKNLLADVSEEWIRRFDKAHSDWKDRSKLESKDYIVVTNAGYEIMKRTMEAMENVNAFYRKFFRYGTPENDQAVPRIALLIYKSEEDYRKQSGAQDWSGGVFTGDSIQTYLTETGFNETLHTLFHEVGHQFVHLATAASSTLWLNEGLATYFEGSQILANGSVIMNLPANHYLFSLAGRMENGWMKDRHDGLDPGNANKVPLKAPTLESVILCNYEWGPPWYAPVWGTIYFFFNYQDPVDGRFVYRKKFREYIDEFGGRSGSGAIHKLEETVLKDPAPPTPGVVTPPGTEPIRLPKKISELNEVWKDFIIRVRDEQSGKVKVQKPYLQWARYAVQRDDLDTAQEHFERGLSESQDDPDLRMDFAQFLALKRKNTDRATKLMLEAVRLIESSEKPDEAKLKEADRCLADWDPQWKSYSEIQEKLSDSAKKLVQGYLDAKLPLMAMDLSWRLGTKLGVPDIPRYYREGYRATGKSLWNWTLAYNEKNLDGWLASGNNSVFQPEGKVLATSLGDFEENNFAYQLLTMDTVIAGDFSLEAEVNVKAGEVNFGGLLVGNKGTQNCQAVILFPGRGGGSSGKDAEGFVDLATFYDNNTFDTHCHTPVKAQFPGWNKLRVDVIGPDVDVWFNDSLIFSHEYPSISVVRGQFGLIAGNGKAQYRNIRFLARDSRDPTAWIEREVRQEKRLADSLAGEGYGGSWLEQKPPWLDKVIWVQDAAKGWQDQGPVPTLLVLWSVDQNRQIPIDAWLNRLASDYADTGLRVLSVVSASDKDRIEGYLKEHPFPGSVGCDQYLKKGYGDTFDLFGVGKQFNLPRLILLDINQKVVWEGDPGFKAGEAPGEGAASYLDTPLKELISLHRLREYFTWHKEWLENGRSYLHDGRFADAARLLVTAQLFDPKYHPGAKEAQRVLFNLQMQFGDPQALAKSLADRQAEPAIETALAWGKLLELEPDPKLVRDLRPVLKGPNADAWTEALAQIHRIERSWRKGKEMEETQKLIDKLKGLSGRFPDILCEEVAQAMETEDADRVKAVLKDAEGIPVRWLAQEYFKW